MRKIFFILTILALCVGAHGQKLSKYYVSRTEPQGVIYHIFPMEVFSDDFVFDITYLSGKDSATVNFTYFAPKKSPVSSIKIDSAEYTVSPLYIEADKVNKWVHRYSCKLPFTTLVNILKKENKPEIKVGETTYHPNGAWKKNISIVETIFLSTMK